MLVKLQHGGHNTLRFKILHAAFVSKFAAWKKQIGRLME
jgi:hypothetical protein